MCAKIIDKKKKTKEIAYGALNVFVKKGFDQTSMNDIAQEIGIAKGSLYGYFSSKNELIETAINLDLEEYSAFISSCTESNISNPEKRIRAIVNEIVESWINNKDMKNFYVATLQMLLSSKTSQKQKRRIIQKFLTCAAFLEQSILEGIEKGIFKKLSKKQKDTLAEFAKVSGDSVTPYKSFLKKIKDVF